MSAAQPLPRARRPPAPRGESGMATAELAVAMPAVVIVLLLALSALAAGAAQMRMTDAARVGARQAAIGADPLAGASAVAPTGSSIAVGAAGDLTCVSISRAAPGPLGRAGLTLRARACAFTEPGGDGP
ncbi:MULTISPECIES: TadE family type IV pilus minor pilin [Actinomyces]|uniref:Pilus assembly protein TadE n=1 Tax=Actinomyces marmotae TaxID=2737173 RepID=A0A6M8B7Q1_9ACTO|nr:MULTISPECIES: TadE family type IV pilus minor pilin [Actinomyces]QKD78935.1 pilus assembly protein TadE [Actinomyces marmotae]